MCLSLYDLLLVPCEYRSRSLPRKRQEQFLLIFLFSSADPRTHTQKKRPKTQDGSAEGKALFFSLLLFLSLSILVL